MNNEIAIEVRDVKKSFKVYKDKGYTLKEKVITKDRTKYDAHDVLNGISFFVEKGESVGLIGHNGCGKSTTLKLLTQIIYPDKGTVKVNGRVSSLLELGAGFHPDMTGRENIYINASIFGLTRKEIEKRIDAIIEFSELEEYMDSPVRTYSSGMYMRLAFSVAINVDADILLIDEILAVGDTNFQIKCRKKLQEIKKKGTTIVLVSHSTEQIESICDRCIWINEGKIKADGTAKDVDAQYLEYMTKVRYGEPVEILERQNQSEHQESVINEEIEVATIENAQEQTSIPQIGSGQVKLVNITSLTKDGKEQRVFHTGEPIVFKMDFRVKESIKGFVRFNICNDEEVICYGSNTYIDGEDIIDFQKDGSMELQIEENLLLNGDYMLSVSIETLDGEVLDSVLEACAFGVHSTGYDLGVCRLKHEWKGI